MASDWIKIRTDLYRDPKVIIMADLLIHPEGDLSRYVNQNCQRDMAVTRNVMRNVTVGALVTVWGVSRHTGKREGNDLFIKQATLTVIDDLADLPGFGAAMEAVGWAEQTKKGVRFPNFFEVFNTDPKENATNKNAERQRRFREKQQALRNVTHNVTDNVTVTHREEKRREENKEEEVPNGTSCSEPENQASEPDGEQKPPQNKSSRVNEVLEVVEIIYPVFPCNGSPKHWTLTPEKIQEYQQAFPGVDCQAETRKAWQWCQDNPTRRKTAKGMGKFLFGWLERRQNSHQAGTNGTNGTHGTHQQQPRQQFKNSTGQKQDHIAEVLRQHMERKQNEQQRNQQAQPRPAINDQRSGSESIPDSPA